MSAAVDLNPGRTRHDNPKLAELVGATRTTTPRPHPDSVDTLLTRADRLPQARIRTAAGRIRSNANFLRTLLADAEKEQELQAEIDRHQAEIDRLRGELRALAAGHDQEEEL